MKPISTTKTLATTDDAPKLTPGDFEKAHFRVGKQRINIMLDAPIIEHFKALAGDRGYQTLIMTPCAA